MRVTNILFFCESKDCSLGDCTTVLLLSKCIPTNRAFLQYELFSLSGAVVVSDTLPALSCRFSSRGWISCDAKRSIVFFFGCVLQRLVHTADWCHRRTSFQSFSRNCRFVSAATSSSSSKHQHRDSVSYNTATPYSSCCCRTNACVLLTTLLLQLSLAFLNSKKRE